MNREAVTAEFPFVELAALVCEKGAPQFKRGQFVRAGSNNAIQSWRDIHRNTDVFASAGHFARADSKSDWSCPLLLAFTKCRTLSEAREQALRASDLLQQRLGIEPTSLDVCFDGHRGFEVGVPPEVFGGIEDSRLSSIWLRVAQRLRERGLHGLDADVYTGTHFVRLPNSINSATGLYRIPLEHAELHDLDVDFVREAAEEPRAFDSMAVPEESAKAIGWLTHLLDSRREDAA